MTQDWLHIQLKTFRADELILDDAETKEVLKFFFPSEGTSIDSTPMTVELKSFAQGLLVTAVDATYAMGWVELTFRWAAKPTSGIKKALQKLAKKGAKYWFKHLKNNQSLGDIEIYETVRIQLSRSFRSPFQILLLAKASTSANKVFTAALSTKLQAASNRGAA